MSAPRHLALSGFMATGKTTLGCLAAARLGLPFVDADAAIEAETGASVRAIWERDGEAGFRAIERHVVTALLDRAAPHVIALGGGAVVDRALRRRVQDRATLVTLEASVETIAARAGDAAGRPNLSGDDPRARIIHLLGARRDAYAEHHARVATDALDPDAAIALVLAAHARDAVLVPLGARSYTVDVASGAPERLVRAIAETSPTRVLWVTDASVAEARAEALEALVRAHPSPATRVVLPAGERHKTLASVETIWRAALDAGADRQSVLVGFGGGVVCDLAGFAASTLLRGIRWIAAPTTLLGMVDAAVGGKTGFDFAGGKNLIGSFHQPSAVVCDVAHLATLAPRERASGMAEVVKIALATDEALVATLEADAPRLARGDADALLPVIRRAVELKAHIVGDDEDESSARALLNLGHTVGHALEADGDFTRLLHGEAVAIGIAVELGASERLGLTSPDVLPAAKRLLEAFGLPTMATPTELERSWRHVGLDKKRSGTAIAWPVLTHRGSGKVVPVELDVLRRAIIDAT